METAICPHCNKEIELEKIVRKFMFGKSKSLSLFNKLASTAMAPASVVYTCPHCNKILAIGE